MFKWNLFSKTFGGYFVLYPPPLDVDLSEQWRIWDLVWDREMYVFIKGSQTWRGFPLVASAVFRISQGERIWWTYINYVLRRIIPSSNTVCAVWLNYKNSWFKIIKIVFFYILGHKTWLHDQTQWFPFLLFHINTPLYLVGGVPLCRVGGTYVPTPSMFLTDNRQARYLCVFFDRGSSEGILLISSASSIHFIDPQTYTTRAADRGYHQRVHVGTVNTWHVFFSRTYIQCTAVVRKGSRRRPVQGLAELMAF